MMTRKEFFEAHNEIIVRAQALREDVVNLHDVAEDFYAEMRYGSHDALAGDDYAQLYDLVCVIEDEDMIDRLNSVLEMIGTVIHSLKLKEVKP